MTFDTFDVVVIGAGPPGENVAEHVVRGECPARWSNPIWWAEDPAVTQVVFTNSQVPRCTDRPAVACRTGLPHDQGDVAPTAGDVCLRILTDRRAVAYRSYSPTNVPWAMVMPSVALCTSSAVGRSGRSIG